MSRNARIQMWIDRAIQQVRDAEAAGETSVLLDGSFAPDVEMFTHWVWEASNDVKAAMPGKVVVLDIQDCTQQPGQKRIRLVWEDA